MIDQEKYEHYVKKYLGFMPKDQQAEVEVTEAGLVYKGNLIVAIRGLKSQLTIKEPVVNVETVPEVPVVPETEDKVEETKKTRRNRKH